MPTPDQHIEHGLSALRPEQPGDAPEAFLGAVRIRRRAVVARRAGAAAVAVLVIGAAVLSLARPPATSTPSETPIVHSPEREPASGGMSLAALREAWVRRGDGADWLPTPDSGASRAGEPLRLSDAGRMLAGDL